MANTLQNILKNSSMRREFTPQFSLVLDLPEVHFFRLSKKKSCSAKMSLKNEWVVHFDRNYYRRVKLFWQIFRKKPAE